MNKIQGLPNASHNSQNLASPENRFPLLFWERVRVKAFSLVHGDEANTAASQIGIAIMLAALLLFAATFARASSDETFTPNANTRQASIWPPKSIQVVKEEWNKTR